MELKPGQSVLQQGDVVLVYDQGATAPTRRLTRVGTRGETIDLPLVEEETTKGPPAPTPLRRRGPLNP